MKIRTGFVSNSSSSSFVCDICSTIESEWDACLEDVGFIKCENEHYICSGCIDKSDVKMVEDKDEGELLAESDCPLCQFKKLSKYDLEGYLLAKYDLDNEKILAEIKVKFKNYRELIKFVNKGK